VSVIQRIVDLEIAKQERNMSLTNISQHPAPPTPAGDHELLSHREAEASIPEDDPVAGEEDPGAAIEDFVALYKAYNH